MKVTYLDLVARAAKTNVFFLFVFGQRQMLPRTGSTTARMGERESDKRDTDNLRV